MTRARDERGVAFPSPLVILSIVAVAMAGITFLATNTDDAGREMSTVSQPNVSSSPTPSARPSTTPEPKATKKAPAPEINRSKVYVEVYNKSNIAGLAGKTSSRATDAGWQVVGTDNWVGGNIPASTVYYPSRLKAEARLLAKDLGIERSVPAVDPMRGDRLTVILTADYAG